MINDRTPNLDLPLPHRKNNLSIDVERLRQALSAIDDVLVAPSEEVQQLEDGQTVVTLNELDSAAGCAVFIEGIRLNKSQWTQEAGAPKRLRLSRSYPAGHEITVVRQ